MSIFWLKVFFLVTKNVNNQAPRQSNAALEAPAVINTIVTAAINTIVTAAINTIATSIG